MSSFRLLGVSLGLTMALGCSHPGEPTTPAASDQADAGVAQRDHTPKHSATSEPGAGQSDNVDPAPAREPTTHELVEAARLPQPAQWAACSKMHLFDWRVVRGDARTPKVARELADRLSAEDDGSFEFAIRAVYYLPLVVGQDIDTVPAAELRATIDALLGYHQKLVDSSARQSIGTRVQDISFYYLAKDTQEFTEAALSARELLHELLQRPMEVWGGVPFGWSSGPEAPAVLRSSARLLLAESYMRTSPTSTENAIQQLKSVLREEEGQPTTAWKAATCMLAGLEAQRGHSEKALKLYEDLATQKLTTRQQAEIAVEIQRLEAHSEPSR